MNDTMRWQHVKLRGRKVSRLHGVDLVVDDQGFLPDDLPAHIYDYLAQLPKSWIRRRRADTAAWDEQIAALKLQKKEAEALEQARTREVVACRQEIDRLQSRIDELEAKKDLETKVVTTDEDKARAARRKAERDAEKKEAAKVAAEAKKRAAEERKRGSKSSTTPKKATTSKKTTPKKAASKGDETPPPPEAESVPTADEVDAALSE